MNFEVLNKSVLLYTNTQTHHLHPFIMSDSMSSFVNEIGTRHEKSLGLLTTRFVSLLQDAKDGILDLKVVSTLGACWNGVR